MHGQAKNLWVPTETSSWKSLGQALPSHPGGPFSSPWVPTHPGALYPNLEQTPFLSPLHHSTSRVPAAWTERTLQHPRTFAHTVPSCWSISLSRPFTQVPQGSWFPVGSQVSFATSEIGPSPHPPQTSGSGSGQAHPLLLLLQGTFHPSEWNDPAKLTWGKYVKIRCRSPQHKSPTLARPESSHNY